MDSTRASGWLVEAACAKTLPAANAPQEAVYWQATIDAHGAKLDGSKDYVIHFPSPGERNPMHEGKNVDQKFTHYFLGRCRARA
jgi:hypothetical protein